jgi:hypothetical protein
MQTKTRTTCFVFGRVYDFTTGVTTSHLLTFVTHLFGGTVYRRETNV